MHFRVSPDPGLLSNVAQFIAPLSALDAIDVGNLVREATADGIDKPHIVFVTTKSAPEGVIVTCQLAMTLRLLCAWTTLIEQAPAAARDAAQLDAARVASGAALMAYVRASHVRTRHRWNQLL